MQCHAERELVLLKIRAPPGPARTEVMQLIDIFRARVVDVSDRSMCIAVTGDSGKVIACCCWRLKYHCLSIPTLCVRDNLRHRYPPFLMIS